MRTFAAAALLLALAACAHPPPASGPAAPSPAPVPESVLATPPATAGVPNAPPAVSPFRYVIDPPPPAPGAPAILEIAVNDQTLHLGTPYAVRVTTSPDVNAVQVEAMGESYGLPPAGPGLFFVTGSVPSDVPFFLLNRSYTLTVIAQTAAGRSTRIQVPMRLER